MPEDRLELIAARHLDGIATAEELAELNGMLADAAARERFADICLQHASLVELGAGLAWAQRRRRRRRLLWLLPAAAAAALAIAVALRHASPAPPRDVEEARQPLDAGAATGADGAALAPGTRVAAAAIGWEAGATRVRLASGATAVIGAAGGPALLLERGSLAAEVAPRPGRPFAIATPLAEVGVVGTAFSVASAEGLTTVSVSQGSVRVRRNADGAQLLLAPGGVAGIAASGPLDHVARELVLDECEEAPPAVARFALADTPGRMSMGPAPTSASGVGALRCVLHAPMPAGGFAIASFMPPAVWRLGGHDGIAVRVRVDAPCRLWVEVLGGGDHQQWERFDTLVALPRPGWNVVRVRWGDLRRREWQPPGAPERGLDPGEINGINLGIADPAPTSFDIDRIAAWTR